MSVQENLNRIKGTLPSGVTLVAVSKTKPESLLLEAYHAGQRDFGENYVQELVGKAEALPKDIRWHFIGHLQSNKVKYIAPIVYLIHGVDSYKLLVEISKQALKHKTSIACLLQLHISGEETKFGFSYKECGECLDLLSAKPLPGIQVIGLMGMASNTPDDTVVRKEYRELSLFFREQQLKHSGIKILSCGMSNDYLIAVEEGSNLVRIGSSLFGERSYENG